MNHLVIMAGGVGSRFWPMSTPERPKQFIDVMGCGRTFLQMTFDRFKGLIPPENVWVVTSFRYFELVKQQLPEIPVGNILLEPCRRNTAPCIAYVSWRVKKQDPKANLVVSPSDHMVTDVVEFQRVIGEALAFTEKSDAILTLGMKPSRPETGYGYIQTDYSHPAPANHDIYEVVAFKEKPNLELAEEYVKQREFLWNAGIFVWRAETIVANLRIFQPEISEVFDRLLPVLGTQDEQEAVNDAFPTCPDISVDYAILEKAEEVYVMPADFGWSDVGTYGSLHTLLKQDIDGNATVGERVELHDSKNCIVHTSEERRVVIDGLDGYIVAEKDNTLLICPLREEQRIKEFSK